MKIPVMLSVVFTHHLLPHHTFLFAVLLVSLLEKLEEGKSWRKEVSVVLSGLSERC